ncbi:MAG: amidohydrolase family protein [Dongiaceae bacterium]
MDLILKGARIAGREDGPPMDIGIGGGRILAIEPDLPTKGPVIEVGNRLVAPGFIECHIHLDKSRIFDRAHLVTGKVPEAFKEVLRLKEDFTTEDVRQRAIQTLERSILHGVTRMRTHLEVDPAVGLRGLDAILPLIDEYRWAIDIEICVFPEEGMIDIPGVESMLTESLKRGCRVIGAAPEADSNPRAQIDRIFEIARDFDVDIDMHLDFGESAEKMLIEYVCDKTEEFGYGGRVTAAHLTMLSTVPRQRFREVCRRMAATGVAATVLPSTDLYLMGRTAECNAVRGVTPVHLMVKEGVTGSIATNNVLNPMTPFGDGSPTRIMSLYANISQIWRREEMADCFDLMTVQPARAMRIDPYGIEVGAPADLVVLDAKDRAQAVMELVRPICALKRGRLTFRRAETELLRP